MIAREIQRAQRHDRSAPGRLAAHATPSGGRWIRLRGGAPLLRDGLVSFDCSVEEIIERHSRAILIGRVEAVRRRRHGGALVYWRGDDEQLGWSADEISSVVGLTALRS